MPTDLERRLEFARRWTAGSPYYERMGFAVEEVSVGRSRIRLGVAAHHLNADGIVHGGVLPALADAAMGSAARTVHGAGAQLLTAESNIRYLRALEGGAVFAEGTVVKAGRRVVFTEVRITDDAGGEIARGGGTFVVQRLER